MSSANSKDRDTRPRTTSNMRKSCHFCRCRKIRCSGQSICGACRDRKIDCVYGVEASKGRPKGSSISSSSKAGISKHVTPETKSNPTKELSMATGQERSSPTTVEDLAISSSKQSFTHFDALMGQSRRNSTSTASPDLRRRDLAGQNGEMEATVGIGMEMRFKVNFVDIDPKSPNSSARAYANFAEKTDSHVRADIMDFESESSKEDSDEDRKMSYDQLLSMLAPDIIESLATRIDSLTAVPTAQSMFYANSLESDTTKTMFDPLLVEHDSDPLEGYDSNQTAQMIEIWFSHHPLSSIISKTLLLRSYRSGTHDKALLSVILADACIILEGPASIERSERLFNWTCSQVKNRPPIPATISTSQTLMLLGWRELCLGHGRRTTCFIGYAGRLIIQLQQDLAAMQAVALGQINGISIAAVELEIVWNMYWLSFSLIIWAFIQMDQPLTDLLPNKTPTIFPPIDSKASTIIKLDIASNNVSTLLPQRRAMRELWPLSHISSTAAYIYALHPQTRGSTEQKPSVEWQSQPASQFRAMLSPKEEVLDVCTNVRQVLSEALRGLETEESGPSAGVVTMAYLIISTHTLFNHLQPVQFSEVPIDLDTLNTFISNAQALISIFNSYGQAQDSSAEAQGENGLKCSISPLLVVAGLKVCGRVLTYVKMRKQIGSMADAGMIGNKRNELLAMTTELLHFAKEEPSLPAKRLRMVKKDLKQVKQYLKETISDAVLLPRLNSLPSLDFKDPTISPVYPQVQRKDSVSYPESSSSISSSVTSVQTPITNFSSVATGVNGYTNASQAFQKALISSPTGPTALPASMDDVNMINATSNNFINNDVWINAQNACISPNFISPSESTTGRGWEQADTYPFKDFAFPLAEFGYLPQSMYHHLDTGLNPGGLDGTGGGIPVSGQDVKRPQWDAFPSPAVARNS